MNPLLKRQLESTKINKNLPKSHKISFEYTRYPCNTYIIVSLHFINIPRVMYNMQQAVKKRHVIDTYGYALSKKVMKRLANKEKSACYVPHM